MHETYNETNPPNCADTLFQMYASSYSIAYKVRQRSEHELPSQKQPIRESSLLLTIASHIIYDGTVLLTCLAITGDRQLLLGNWKNCDPFFMYACNNWYRVSRISWLGTFGPSIIFLKVHLTPNTISAKMQTWSCSKSDLTFFCNIWNFFEQQYNLKFDTLCLMTELVRGMGLFSIWRHKLFCMHVHKELMPCKWVCDVKSRIEPGPC